MSACEATPETAGDVRLGVAWHIQTGYEFSNDFALVLVDKIFDAKDDVSDCRTRYVGSSDMTHVATDVKPSDLAGVSGFELDELASPEGAVAALGIGNAAGRRRSRTTTDTLWGSPSFTCVSSLTPYMDGV